nr:MULTISPECIES: LPXTG cell wall anchor domain-containing protein [unclassified Rathayibacter]
MWTATLTNIGDAPLYDVSLSDLSDEVDLSPGETASVSVTTTLGQRELDEHTAVLSTFASGDTEEGAFISIDLTGRLALPIPATALTPATAAPAPATPTPTPGTPTPGTPTASPATAPAAPATPAAAASRSAGSSTGGSAAAATSGRRLADTGSDAAGALPGAGLLAALGALGVLLGRRRRNRTAD